MPADKGTLPKLKPGQQYALPFNRGNKGIQWQYFPSEDAINNFFRPNSKYVNWPSSVEIVSIAASSAPGVNPQLELQAEYRRGESFREAHKYPRYEG